MKYYVLDPEVAGELGNNTVMDVSVHPPLVSKLHYELDAWLGDDLIQSFPCYLVTERLKKHIENASLAGVSFAPVELELSANFKELHPSKTVPDFVWLNIFGKAGRDDFAVASDGRLVVSEPALKLLKNMTLKHCKIQDLKMITFSWHETDGGGKRTSIKIDGETVLQGFEKGAKVENSSRSDSNVCRYVYIVCSGDSLPDEAEAARAWLLEITSIIQKGIKGIISEIHSRDDFSAPVSRVLPGAGPGITIGIIGSTIRRLKALDIADALTEVSSHWKEILNRLEVLEPLK